jgi:hypothetical protein
MKRELSPAPRIVADLLGAIGPAEVPEEFANRVVRLETPPNRSEGTSTRIREPKADADQLA